MQNAVSEYSASSAAEADARAFYKVMQTLASDSDIVKEAITAKDWSVFTDYVNNFSDLYEKLENITSTLESCVVVTVYCDPTTKELYCEVSPNSILEDS